MSNWYCVKENRRLDNAHPEGVRFLVLGPSISVRGMLWTPILPEGDEYPMFIKAHWVGAEEAVMLKPCPFCGGKAVGPECLKDYGSLWQITCTNFCIWMRRNDKKILVANWNRRL